MHTYLPIRQISSVVGWSHWEVLQWLESAHLSAISELYDIYSRLLINWHN